MKIYELKMYGEKYKITLRKGNYRDNKTLAVEMVLVDSEGEITEPWGMLTVNIDSSNVLASETRAFVDTNNNGEEIIGWLEKNNIATPKGLYGQSGWCSYPLVEFNSQALAEMTEID